MKTNTPSPKSLPTGGHVLFWVILYLFYLLQNIFFNDGETGSNGYTVLERALLVFFYQFSIIASSYFICFRIIPFFIERKRVGRGIGEFIVGVYVIAVIQRILVIYALEPLLRGENVGQEKLTQILSQVEILLHHYVMGALSGSFPFVIFYLLIERQQMIRRQAGIEKEKVVAELSALKSQLNPHFLFNTLNSIYSLAVQQSRHTAPTVDKLSQILDYLLYRCNDSYVPIDREIQVLDNYLELQKTRFGSRLVVDNNYNTDGYYTIAPLLLLSIVENMFKHGVEKTTDTVQLFIKTEIEAGVLNFLAENPFDSSRKVVEGLGLKNLRRQLALLYPQKHSLKIRQTTDTFVVQLQLNLL